MYCKNCGTENEQGNAFCENCGTKLENETNSFNNLAENEKVKEAMEKSKQAFEQSKNFANQGKETIQKEMKKNPIYFKIGIPVVIIIILAVVGINMMSVSSEQAVTNYFVSIKEKDIEKYENSIDFVANEAFIESKTTQGEFLLDDFEYNLDEVKKDQEKLDTINEAKDKAVEYFQDNYVDNDTDEDMRVISIKAYPVSASKKLTKVKVNVRHRVEDKNENMRFIIYTHKKGLKSYVVADEYGKVRIDEIKGEES